MANDADGGSQPSGGLTMPARLASALSRLKMSWGIFAYNYTWDSYVRLLDGWVPKCAVLVPFFGYAILFNDSVSELLDFGVLTGNQSTGWSLSNTGRLRCIYFGLIFLGSANLLYWIRRPWVMRIATNMFDYIDRGLTKFTLGNFIDMHHTIRSEGHLTRDGKYYDSEWDGFRAAAVNRGEGTKQIEQTGNWDEAKSRYGSLLRSMLRETFFRGSRDRRLSLTICLTLAIAGYALLAIPSIDLFIRVVLATISTLPAG